jgi:hypothetical protein
MAVQRWLDSSTAAERFSEVLLMVVLCATVAFLFALVWFHGPEAMTTPMPGMPMPGMPMG